MGSEAEVLHRSPGGSTVMYRLAPLDLGEVARVAELTPIEYSAGQRKVLRLAQRRSDADGADS